MDVFRKVVSVQIGGITMTLNWDGRDGFILEGLVPAAGHRVEAEKTAEEARCDLTEWGEAACGGELKVLLADEGALAKLMEGLEWRPLRASS